MMGGEGPGFLDGYRRDYYGGALMVLIGLGAAIQGRTYSIGTLTQMGAGFFPVALGVVLIVLGALIAGNARRTAPEDGLPAERSLHMPVKLEWRGWLCILAGIAAFVVLGQWGGLLIATFAITFISALGDRDNTWLSAFVLASIMALIAVMVFWWALQLQIPLFGWG
jgi:hypothetical protein